ncbi:nucleotidyltransferase domain-containing protein [Bacillus alkalicellulosilyticus]|uniref:nucleotidyltransferase domain-containing protein n=1 Tax=Alkalihalobacterium alkalicellulosilyticum TaxID=1912214 RepID=UPI000998A5E1|nr:nucleotidyltransferase domain-containing protein [Bacillus alkalicellulosilyticus]
MHLHHKQTIENVGSMFMEEPDVLALLVVGSIAHGFERPQSDVDIMIIVSEESYKKRESQNSLTYYNTELCSYDGGYVDGKYITISFMKEVAEKGSEPARFAFEGAKIVISKIEGLQQLIDQITLYPVQRKKENIIRFYAQFEAWHWYCHESIKQENRYLYYQAATSFILFSGRLLLAHNQKLYPYHKWFLKVLEGVKDKPEYVMENISKVLEGPNLKSVEELYKMVKNYTDWGVEDINWPHQFMIDSELNWQVPSIPVADL